MGRPLRATLALMVNGEPRRVRRHQGFIRNEAVFADVAADRVSRAACPLARLLAREGSKD